MTVLRATAAYRLLPQTTLVPRRDIAAVLLRQDQRHTNIDPNLLADEL